MRRRERFVLRKNGSTFTAYEDRNVKKSLLLLLLLLVLIEVTLHHVTLKFSLKTGDHASLAKPCLPSEIDWGLSFRTRLKNIPLSSPPVPKLSSNEFLPFTNLHR